MRRGISSDPAIVVLSGRSEEEDDDAMASMHGARLDDLQEVGRRKVPIPTSGTLKKYLITYFF